MTDHAAAAFGTFAGAAVSACSACLARAAPRRALASEEVGGRTTACAQMTCSTKRTQQATTTIVHLWAVEQARPMLSGQLAGKAASTRPMEEVPHAPLLDELALGCASVPLPRWPGCATASRAAVMMMTMRRRRMVRLSRSSAQRASRCQDVLPLHLPVLTVRRRQLHG